MPFLRRAIISAALAFCVPAFLFASKNNDFTKANSSFAKKFISERSAEFDKKSRLNDREFKSKEYNTPDNAGWIREREFVSPDSTNVDNMSDKKAFNNKKTFDDMPDNAPGKKDWSKADTHLNLDNADKDLGKKYEGRIDFDNRPDFYGEKYLQEHYSEMVEKSMQDINKYYFRSSRSTDSGIPTTVAGAELHGEENKSIFDLLSKDKKIERPSVSLKGPAKGLLDSTSVPSHRVETDSTQPVSQKQTIPQLPTPPSKQTQNKNIQQTGISREISKQNVDQKTIDSFDFMRVPDAWKTGTPSMKVEVRDE